MLDVKSLTLEDTVPLMRSECFKDRLRAEYWQTAIRYEKLLDTILAYHAGSIEYIPRVSLEDCQRQAGVMSAYLAILSEQAKVDGADLNLPLTYLYDDEEEDFDE